jgi:hypothetical protein
MVSLLERIIDTPSLRWTTGTVVIIPETDLGRIVPESPDPVTVNVTVVQLFII